MEFEQLGEKLTTLCSSAEREVLLVSPYIKNEVVTRILEYVPRKVKLICFTRWIIQEIVAGYNDLEVFHLITTHPNGQIFINPRLHAKYYRVDDISLVGSANLTSAALGWSNHSNLELLVVNERSAKFERRLFEESTLVDEAIFRGFSLSAKIYRDTTDASATKSYQTSVWFPETRNPGDLYLAYLGQYEKLIPVAQSACRLDLSYLDIPNGLNLVDFRLYVAYILFTKKNICDIDNFVASPRSFKGVERYLETNYYGQLTHGVERTWQTLMRWLLYFLPTRYELKSPEKSEIFRRLT